MLPYTATAIESFNKLVPLAPEERTQLTSLLRNRRNLRPRATLVERGNPQSNLLFILAGWVAEYRLLANGKRQILYIGLPGEVVAAQDLFYPSALLSIEALSPCVVASIDVSSLANEGPSLSKLRDALILGAVRRNAILQEWMISIGRRTGFQRVAALLIELTVRLRMRGLSSGNSTYCPLRQQDIADATGLTGPYVNQILKKMRRVGWLDIVNGCLVIKSEALLIKAAEFNADYLKFPRSEVALKSWTNRDPLSAQEKSVQQIG